MKKSLMQQLLSGQIVNEEKRNYSHTQLITMFAKCPATWSAKYVSGEERLAGGAASFGLGYEAAIAERVGFVVKNKPSMEAIAAADAYMEWEPGIKKGEPLEYQKAIELKDPTMKFPLIGFIDFVRQNDTVVDIKTAGKFEFKADWLLQVVLYASCLGLPKWEVHVHNKKTKKLVNSFKLYKGEVSSHLRKEVLASYVYFAKMIEVRNDFGTELARIPGDWCRWCCDTGCHTGRVFMERGGE